MIEVGSYIKSTFLLNGSYFENSTIYIVEKNAEGAIGFFVNRPFGRSLNELKEFSKSKPFPLLEGGPVDQEHIYVVHSRPDVIEGSQLISYNKYFGGSIQEVIHAINVKDVRENEIQLFLGYCGWDANELEMEIEEGSWTIVSE
jgi:putative transcriptional regulator